MPRLPVVSEVKGLDRQKKRDGYGIKQEKPLPKSFGNAGREVLEHRREGSVSFLITVPQHRPVVVVRDDAGRGEVFDRDAVSLAKRVHEKALHLDKVFQGFKRRKVDDLERVARCRAPRRAPIQTLEFFEKGKRRLDGMLVGDILNTPFHDTGRDDCRRRFMTSPCFAVVSFGAWSA